LTRKLVLNKIVALEFQALRLIADPKEKGS